MQVKNFLTILLCTIVSCVTFQTTRLDKSIQTNTVIREGWVDDHTFRIVAVGTPKEDLNSRIKRRITSREAAITMAQKLILERFKGSKVSGRTTVKEGTTTEMITVKEFNGIIQGGIVVSESYDEEDNCEIVYQIHGIDLKAKLQAGIR